MNKIATATRSEKIITAAILMMIFMTSGVAAADHILISEVLYDPTGTETGGEAIELYNPTGTDVDISEFTIKTETSSSDAVIPEDTVIPAGSFYLITDTGWASARDNMSWPDADHEEPITMSNSDAGVALVNSNGIIIDAVGWGDTAGIDETLYEGTPLSGTSSGKSISRTYPAEDTDNNSADFSIGIPDLQNSQSDSENEDPGNNPNGEMITLGISVQNNAPVIQSVLIDVDDDPVTEGNQIMPNPGELKEVRITAIIKDDDGISSFLTARTRVNGPERTWDINLEKTEDLDNYTAEYTGNLALEFFDSPGDYILDLSVSDSSENASMTKTFNYMSMTAIAIDTTTLSFKDAQIGTTAELQGDEEFPDTSYPTLKNIGNTLLDIGMYGTDLSSGTDTIPVSNIKYSFNNDFSGSMSGILGKTLQIKQLSTPRGQQTLVPLGFQLSIPAGTAKGEYTGTVNVIAISS